MQPPPFWQAPYPFSDFLLLAQKAGSLDARLEEIDSRSAALGLRLVPLAKHGEIDGHLITAEADLPADDPFTLLSGMARTGISFYFGQRSLPSGGATAGLGESAGIFTALLSDGAGFTVTQDFFGCGILFEFSGPGFFAVSNRYHLLLLFLSWIGHEGRLDFDKVISTLFSNGTFFHQNVSHSMDIEGVRQVPLDHEVRVDARGWRLVPKPAVRQALSGSPEASREELVLRGRQEVLDNVRAAVESGHFTKIVADLSGGMDSRAVLGAILNLEQARARTQLRTNDVPGSRDLEIAAGLANLFGLPFYSDEGRAQQPLAVGEALDIWRSYFMGVYHRVGATSWSPQGRNLKELRLSGGCGEVHRTFWSKIYHRAVAAPASTRDIATRLVETSAPASARACGAAVRVTDLLEREFEALPGQEAVERFENHYLFFRNRYHFGMRAVETFYDSPMWFPLMSRSLFAAARTQAPLDRGNALILELTERLHPLLICIDYDSVSVADNPLLPTIALSDNRFRGCRVALDTGTAAWERAQRENRDRLMQSRWPMDPAFNSGWRDYSQRLRAETVKAVADLEAVAPAEDKPLMEVLLREVEGFADDPRLVAQFFSKAASLRDQLAIFKL